MAKTVKPERLTDYMHRVLRGFTQGAKDAAQIHVEYYDSTYQVHRTVAAKSIRMEVSEHGPVMIIISENEHA